MKLSKKGAEKISTNCKNVRVIGTDDFFPPIILEGADKLEFEQSDFTGAVVLTVGEAKQLQEDFLDIVCEIVRLVGRYGVKYEKPDSLIILEE